MERQTQTHDTLFYLVVARKAICHVREVNKCPEQQIYATTGGMGKEGRREHAKIGRAEEEEDDGWTDGANNCSI